MKNSEKSRQTQGPTASRTLEFATRPMVCFYRQFFKVRDKAVGASSTSHDLFCCMVVLLQAMEGWGTDETKLTQMICCKSP